MNLFICDAYCQDYEQTKKGNFQGIKENLLRLATKYCENYATDILILLEHIDNVNKERMDEGYSTYTFEFGFRQFGIDWPLKADGHYRYRAELKKDGIHFELTGELGNV
jgi:hypothetical protein